MRLSCSTRLLWLLNKTRSLPWRSQVSAGTVFGRVCSTWLCSPPVAPFRAFSQWQNAASGPSPSNELSKSDQLVLDRCTTYSLQELLVYLSQRATPMPAQGQLQPSIQGTASCLPSPQRSSQHAFLAAVVKRLTQDADTPHSPLKRAGVQDIIAFARFLVDLQRSENFQVDHSLWGSLADAMAAHAKTSCQSSSKSTSPLPAGLELRASTSQLHHQAPFGWPKTTAPGAGNPLTAPPPLEWTNPEELLLMAQLVHDQGPQLTPKVHQLLWHATEPSLYASTEAGELSPSLSHPASERLSNFPSQLESRDARQSNVHHHKVPASLSLQNAQVMIQLSLLTPNNAEGKGPTNLPLQSRVTQLLAQHLLPHLNLPELLRMLSLCVYMTHLHPSFCTAACDCLLQLLPDECSNSTPQLSASLHSTGYEDAMKMIRKRAKSLSSHPELLHHLRSHLPLRLRLRSYALRNLPSMTTSQASSTLAVLALMGASDRQVQQLLLLGWEARVRAAELTGDGLADVASLVLQLPPGPTASQLLDGLMKVVSAEIYHLSSSPSSIPQPIQRSPRQTPQLSTRHQLQNSAARSLLQCLQVLQPHCRYSLSHPPALADSGAPVSPPQLRALLDATCQLLLALHKRSALRLAPDLSAAYYTTLTRMDYFPGHTAAAARLQHELEARVWGDQATTAPTPFSLPHMAQAMSLVLSQQRDASCGKSDHPAVMLSSHAGAAVSSPAPAAYKACTLEVTPQQLLQLLQLLQHVKAQLRPQTRGGKPKPSPALIAATLHSSARMYAQLASLGRSAPRVYSPPSASSSMPAPPSHAAADAHSKAGMGQPSALPVGLSPDLTQCRALLLDVLYHATSLLLPADSSAAAATAVLTAAAERWPAQDPPVLARLVAAWAEMGAGDDASVLCSPLDKLLFHQRLCSLQEWQRLLLECMQACPPGKVADMVLHAGCQASHSPAQVASLLAAALGMVPSSSSSSDTRSRAASAAAHALQPLTPGRGDLLLGALRGPCQEGVQPWHTLATARALVGRAGAASAAATATAAADCPASAATASASAATVEKSSPRRGGWIQGGPASALAANAGRLGLLGVWAAVVDEAQGHLRRLMHEAQELSKSATPRARHHTRAPQEGSSGLHGGRQGQQLEPGSRELEQGWSGPQEHREHRSDESGPPSLNIPLGADSGSGSRSRSPSPAGGAKLWEVACAVQAATVLQALPPGTLQALLPLVLSCLPCSDMGSVAQLAKLYAQYSFTPPGFYQALSQTPQHVLDLAPAAALQQLLQATCRARAFAAHELRVASRSGSISTPLAQQEEPIGRRPAQAQACSTRTREQHARGLLMHTGACSRAVAAALSQQLAQLEVAQLAAALHSGAMLRLPPQHPLMAEGLRELVGRCKSGALSYELAELSWEQLVSLCRDLHAGLAVVRAAAAGGSSNGGGRPQQGHQPRQRGGALFAEADGDSIATSSNALPAPPDPPDPPQGTPPPPPPPDAPPTALPCTRDVLQTIGSAVAARLASRSGSSSLRDIAELAAALAPGMGAGAAWAQPLLQAATEVLPKLSMQSLADLLEACADAPGMHMHGAAWQAGVLGSQASPTAATAVAAPEKRRRGGGARLEASGNAADGAVWAEADAVFQFWRTAADVAGRNLTSRGGRHVATATIMHALARAGCPEPRLCEVVAGALREEGEQLLDGCSSSSDGSSCNFSSSGSGEKGQGIAARPLHSKGAANTEGAADSGDWSVGSNGGGGSDGGTARHRFAYRHRPYDVWMLVQALDRMGHEDKHTYNAAVLLLRDQRRKLRLREAEVKELLEICKRRGVSELLRSVWEASDF